MDNGVQAELCLLALEQNRPLYWGTSRNFGASSNLL
jgi:hypothetical protein